MWLCWKIRVFSLKVLVISDLQSSLQWNMTIPHWPTAYTTPDKNTAAQVCHQDVMSTCAHPACVVIGFYNCLKVYTYIDVYLVWRITGSRMCVISWKKINTWEQTFFVVILSGDRIKPVSESRVPHISSCGLFTFHFSSEYSCLPEPDIWRRLQTKPGVQAKSDAALLCPTEVL